MEALETLNGRGKGILEFLDYCVRSMQMDPLFVYLAQEYRCEPTVPKAVALFHTFCGPTAPARVSVNPDEHQMQKAMRPITVTWTRMQAALVFGPGNGAPPMPPPTSLFDRVVDQITQAGILTKLKRRFLNAQNADLKTDRVQHFVERIWEPIIRPHLVAAGFWQIAGLA